ncbi:uncharacterized protein [Miscanthus floridulus]|uniref:uncharacterized protein n=1 Tax=Miscanthus floridulus TaxID=154761 RepID=UPI00345A07B8
MGVLCELNKLMWHGLNEERGLGRKNQNGSFPTKEPVEGLCDKSNAAAAAEPESPAPPSERSQERTHGSPEAGGRNSPAATAAEAAAAAKRKDKETVASPNRGSAGGKLPPPPSAAYAPRATELSAAAKPPFPQCSMTAAKVAAASAMLLRFWRRRENRIFTKTVFNDLVKSPMLWPEKVKKLIWRKIIPMARIIEHYKVLEMATRQGVEFNSNAQNLGIDCAYSEFRRRHGHGEFFYRSFICCNVMVGAPGGEPPPPPGPPPQRPPDDKLFCPWQDSLEHRQRALSPFTEGRYCIPVTPLCNPKTNLSSHFILRLTDSEDQTYAVDCLVRDVDLYFVAFWRRLILSAEEE